MTSGAQFFGKAPGALSEKEATACGACSGVVLEATGFSPCNGAQPICDSRKSTISKFFFMLLQCFFHVNSVPETHSIRNANLIVMQGSSLPCLHSCQAPNA